MSSNLIEKLPWYLKWRPRTLNGGNGEYDLGIVLDSKTKSVVSEWKKEGNIPHTLMIGKSGIGKTTLAKIIAEEILECEEVFEMNASKDRGIDSIRNEIVNFCSGQSYNGGIKCVIIGEADGLTIQAQDCLNEVIENYALNTRFVFTANDANKISPAIISRCTKLELEYSKESYADRCKEILQKENVRYIDGMVDKILNTTYPDFRQGLEVLKLNTVDGVLNEVKLKNDEFMDTLWRMIVVKEEPFKIRKFYIENYEKFSGDYYRLLSDLISVAIHYGFMFKERGKDELYNDCLWFISRANRAIRDEKNHRDAELNTFQVMIEVSNKDFAI